MADYTAFGLVYTNGGGPAILDAYAGPAGYTSGGSSTPAAVTYFHMIGYDSVLGHLVPWRVTGAADMDGSEYSTPANLVLASIRVGASWTV